MNYLGDFPTSATVYCLFHTFSSDDPSASMTITGLATTDIEIYKNGGTTQRASDNGYTLLDTDGIDFDTITGIHGISIDTSDNSDAGFYAAGNEYTVVISSITLDGATINFIAGTFSIERSGGALALLKHGTYGLSALDTELGTLATAAALTTVDTVVDGIQTDLSNGTDGLGALKTLIDTVDTVVDAIKVVTDALPDSGALTSLAQASVCTEARLAELGAANLPADIDAILTDTGTTLETHLTDIKGGTFSGATDSLEAIRDRGDAAWTTGAGGSDRLLMVDTTIATLSTQTSFTLTAGSADDDAYNNCTIIVEDVSTSTQKAVGMVLDYTGSTKTVTLKEALAFTIAATDKVYILAENSLKSTVANRQLDVTANGNAGIDWANVENPTTALDLSGTDIQLVDTTTTNTDMRGTDNAATAASLATAQTDLDTITGSDGVTLATAQANYAPSKAGDAMTLTAAATSAQLVDDIWDETLASGHDTADTTGKYLKQVKEAVVSVESTVNDASATTTSFVTALTEATDDHYKDVSLVFTGGALIGQSRPILSYNGTTKTITLDEALTEAPANGVSFIIRTDHVHPTSQMADAILDEALAGHTTAGTLGKAVADIETDATAILADTNELQTDWTNGGRLDLILDANLAMLDDARSEPGQGAPPVNADAMTKLDYLYKAWRNKIEQTSTETKLYDDAGTTVDQKATVSDDGTTFTKGEQGSGP